MKTKDRLTTVEKIARSQQLAIPGTEARIADEKMQPRKVQAAADDLPLWTGEYHVRRK